MKFLLVTNCGRNLKNIKIRIEQGVGIIGEIFVILDSISFGTHYFKFALLLRETLLLSAILYNCSVWYNVTKKEIQELSNVDSIFFSRLFSVPSKSPGESYFLETGVLEINTIIKSRRIVYFHNLVNSL